MQAARANTAEPTQRLWSKAGASHYSLDPVAPGQKQQEEGLGSLKGDIRKILALAEKGDSEQLLHGTIDDQEM